MRSPAWKNGRFPERDAKEPRFSQSWSWENGGSPGPCLGKRSFSGVGTTLLSQVQMVSFTCFQHLQDLRNAAIRADMEKQCDQWKKAQGLSPHGVPPFVFPFCIPLPRPGPALPSDRLPGNIHISSSNQHVGQKENISGQQDRRRRRKVRQDSQGEVGKRAAEAVQNYPHNKYVRTYVRMCVRTWGREPRTCVIPSCTGRLRPPVSCPSPARPLDSRGGKPSIGMPPTSENGRLHGQSVCRTPVLQPISFGERPFPCTAASETAFFFWPAPTEILVPTYIRTHVHTYVRISCV